MESVQVKENYVISGGAKMIEIKQIGEKWRIAIKNEEWEFDSLNSLENTLKQILNLKNTYGKLSDRFDKKDFEHRNIRI
jgi:hypothetical protein